MTSQGAPSAAHNNQGVPNASKRDYVMRLGRDEQSLVEEE